MPDIDLSLFQFFNGMAGRSWWVDSFIALAMANDLIKSAIIGACFFAAWYSGMTESATLAARRALLITLTASLLTLATTTVISHLILQPRPYLQAHKIYQLKANQQSLLITAQDLKHEQGLVLKITRTAATLSSGRVATVRVGDQ